MAESQYIHCYSGSIVHQLGYSSIAEEALFLGKNMLYLPKKCLDKIPICETISSNCFNLGISLNQYKVSKNINIKEFFENLDKCILKAVVNNLPYYNNIIHLNKELYHYISLEDIKDNHLLIFDGLVSSLQPYSYKGWLCVEDINLSKWEIVEIKAQNIKREGIQRKYECLKESIKNYSEKEYWRYYLELKFYIGEILDKGDIYKLLLHLGYDGIECSRYAFFKMCLQIADNAEVQREIQSGYNKWRANFVKLKLVLLKDYYSKDHFTFLFDKYRDIIFKIIQEEVTWIKFADLHI